MIPKVSSELMNDFQEKTIPSLTYKIDGNRIYGTIDNIDAVRQSVWLILSTERFAYSIYTWNYGTELSALLGVSPPLVYVLLQQRISEALMQDDRITEVTDFSFSSDFGNVTATFTVKSIYGDIQTKKELSYV